jgi:hypothetical protein
MKFLVSFASFSFREARGAAGALAVTLAATLAVAFETGFFFAMIDYFIYFKLF